MKRFLLALICCCLLQGCFAKKQKYETIKDIFFNMNIGMEEKSIPKIFTHRPDGNYELFINQFSVKVYIDNKKVRKISAEKDYGNRGEHIAVDYKKLRAEIFYQWKDKENSTINADYINKPETHSIKTWNNPIEYCRYPELGSGAIQMYLNKKRDCLMELRYDGGQDIADCDNRARAARDWFVGSRNGSITITKLKLN